MTQYSMEQLAAYCSQYGFIFQGSGIYGGLANTWDYGPLGTRLKNNIKDAWRDYFIQRRENSYELDSNILMNPRVWEASGHVDSFSDPMLDCRECRSRFRADNLLDDWDAAINADGMTVPEMEQAVSDHKIPCPKCGKHNFTPIRQFNLMFQTERGAAGDSTGTVYLRPENAQGEYVNYLNVLRTMRAKLPFGIGQIGKAFRNEIAPRNFTFRTIEFEQMEYQTFCREGQDEDLYEYYKEYGLSFFRHLGIAAEHLRFHDHEKLAHYAKAACDIEYRFQFGWGEINGTHNRMDFDLRRHQEYSGKTMTVYDEEAGVHYLPYVVESTYGLDRIVLAVLSDALEDEVLPGGETRQVLRLSPALAPYKTAVFPLIRKHHSGKAQEICSQLRRRFMVSYDDTGNIGKRYRRTDAIGTPYAVTVDDNTLTAGTVTVRERDSMKQEIVSLECLEAWLDDKLQV